MWFVARCLKGIEPPPDLTPEMVPPSFRTTKSADGLVVSIPLVYNSSVFPSQEGFHEHIQKHGEYYYHSQQHDVVVEVHFEFFLHHETYTAG